MPAASYSKLFLYLCSSFCVASANLLDTTVVVRAPDDVPNPHVIRDISHELRRAVLADPGRTWKANTTFDTSWDGAILLKLGADQAVFARDDIKASNGPVASSSGIEIVCRTCYLKGTATGELSVSQNFNISQSISELESEVDETVRNLTIATKEYVEDLIDGVGNEVKEFFHGDFNFDDFAAPTWNFTFDIDVPSIPDANLRFTFDELELYMLIDTTLSGASTYTLPLYRSNTPIGLSITEKLKFGVLFDVDLILSAEAAIIIASGLHLKIEDGFAIDIVLFGKDPSSLTFRGGQFEFLPVTIETGGVVLTAALRVGLHTGLQLATPDLGIVANISLQSIGGGVEVGVFANVAEFTTNITYVPEDEKCALAVVQSYQLGLGAAAGATIHVGDKRWGPAASTTKAIFTTELASACAISGTPAAVTPPTVGPQSLLDKRQGLSMLTLTHETTFTGVNCLSAGLINCPASLLRTSLSKTTITLTTAVPSGVDDDDASSSIWPSSAAIRTAAAITPVPFGKNAMALPKTSGSPVAYTAAATGGAVAIGDIIDPKDLPIATIVGVSVGVGVPVLLAIVACSWLLLRRRRARKPVA